MFEFYVSGRTNSLGKHGVPGLRKDLPVKHVRYARVRSLIEVDVACTSGVAFGVDTVRVLVEVRAISLMLEG